MKAITVAVLMVLVGACATPSPAPKVTEAKKAYADCLGRELPKSAKSALSAEGAADAAIRACDAEHTALYKAVQAANQNDQETALAMADYDTRTRADAEAYISELRKD
ncbi:hypothetical protein [Dongia sp. agr-C8]